MKKETLVEIIQNEIDYIKSQKEFWDNFNQKSTYDEEKIRGLETALDLIKKYL